MKNKKGFSGLISFAVGVFLFGYFMVDGNSFEELKKGIDDIANDINKVQEEIKYESNEYLNVRYIDVGQADAILIRQNDKNMLIDAGNNEDGEKLVKYFEELDITEFEYVVATHAHEDHIGGMDDIIKNFKVNNFYMPDVMTTTKTFEDVLDSLLEKGMTYKTPKIGDEITFDKSVIKVLSVTNDNDDLNDNSIVLKLNFAKNSFLFMGDATEKIEKNILNEDIESDVLKVGHHGSSYSSSVDFLKAVNPKYAIISSGIGNTYNHPHDVVLDRLKKQNISVYRTDTLGTITAISDGETINIKSEKTDTNG